MRVYGFGSYFKGSETFNDIDLLIVHESCERNSCLDAIRLKREIIARIENADVVMLSISEEACFDFIDRAFAIPLILCESDFDENVLNELISKLHSFMG
jgi:predicted nucleotidyltransferase